MMAVLYIPSLVSLLVNAEKQKGSGLTQQEVEKIRDNATCISVPDNLVRGWIRHEDTVILILQDAGRHGVTIALRVWHRRHNTQSPDYFAR